MISLVTRVVMWLSLLAVVVVSGAHFVYYLLNWEWNRAGIAGAAFTASLVLGGTLLVLGRLRRLERRLEEVLVALRASTAAQVPAVAPPKAAVPVTTDTPAPEIEPRPDFPWLSPTSSVHALGPVLLAAVAWEPPEQAVFIPVFLAAGIAISAVAGGVERLAALRHRVAGTPVLPPPPPTARELLDTRPRMAWLLIPVVGAAVAGLVVGGLYIASHYWSKPIGPGITTMTVEVDNRGPITRDVDVVDTVGRYCSLNAGTVARFRGVEAGPGGATLLRLAPLLDDDAQRRYIGCVEDAVLEWHRLTVTATELTPR